MNGTLSILLTDGTLYNKDLRNHAQAYLEFMAMTLLYKHQVVISMVQSMWFQPDPINITLEHLEL